MLLPLPSPGCLCLRFLAGWAGKPKEAKPIVAAMSTVGSGEGEGEGVGEGIVVDRGSWDGVV